MFSSWDSHNRLGITSTLSFDINIPFLGNQIVIEYMYIPIIGYSTLLNNYYISRIKQTTYTEYRQYTFKISRFEKGILYPDIYVICTLFFNLHIFLASLVVVGVHTKSVWPIHTNVRSILQCLSCDKLILNMDAMLLSF